MICASHVKVAQQGKTRINRPPSISVLNIFVTLLVHTAVNVRQVQCLKHNEHLKSCTYDNQTVPEGSPWECEVELEKAATKRNHIHLVSTSPDMIDQSMSLPCGWCPDQDIKKFQWFWIPRTTTGTVFDVDVGDEELNKQFVKPYKPRDKNAACFDPHNYDLFFESFDPTEDAGSYVCRHEDSANPSNRIFRHIDYIEDSSDLMTRIKLPKVTQEGVVMETLEQLRHYHELTVADVMSVPDFQDDAFGLITITSLPRDNFTTSFGCGRMQVQIERKCFIRLPTNPDVYLANNNAERVIAKILWSAFEFLNVKDQSLRSGAKLRAYTLGFELRPPTDNSSFIYIPCRYTLLKQLPQIDDRFDAFERYGLRTMVEYMLICQSLDPMELINLALQSDMQRFKKRMLAYEDIRSMHIERIAIDGDSQYDLTCSVDPAEDEDGSTGGGGTIEDDNGQVKSSVGTQCSPDTVFPPVLWRSTAGGLVYASRSQLEERVHVTDACSLRFESVRPNDSGIYHCFLRDLQSLSGWRKQPRLAYKLSVERAHFKWPSRDRVVTGLFFLSAWAVVVTFGWLCMLGYNYMAYSTAANVAEQRQRKIEAMQDNRPRAWTSEYRRMSSMMVRSSDAAPE